MQRTRILVGGLCIALGASLARAQECPVVPELPPHPIDMVFQAWVASTEPMKAAVEIRQIGKSSFKEVQATGEVRVLAKGTVHYRLRESLPKPPATDAKPGAAEIAVEFYRRGPVVVCRSSGPPRKVALTDCRADEPRTPAAEGGGAGLTVLEAAVGGTEGEARARARLVQWVVFLADPRRIFPDASMRDISGYGDDRTPTLEVNVPIPRELRISLTSAVEVKEAALSLKAPTGGSTTEAIVGFHCAGNKADDSSFRYFDASIHFLRIEKATELDVPPEVEALLQAAAADK